MTPAARTQAAIELLDGIIVAAREGGAAADTLIARYFATRRYAGSKDRRAVRERVYAAIRLCGELPASGRAAMLTLARTDPDVAATFDGSSYGPAAIAPGEPIAAEGVAPGWLSEALADSGIGPGAQEALIERAPLDVRVNTLQATPADLAETLPGATPIEPLPSALRLPAGTDLAPYAGQLEVQDAGSQAVTLAIQPRPGLRVLDLCAGAGGKSLALAAAMENDGVILASDTDRGRLSRLAPRAVAAGVTIVASRLLDPGREAAALEDWAASADAVLIDAPCSGTGTWRRNPEARWRLTPDRLARLTATQARLLDIGAALVRPGGALVYVVCSLLDVEGREQVEAFITAHPQWQFETVALPLGREHGTGWRLTPDHDGSDGFFVARLRAPC